MALTIAETAVDAWAETAQNAVREGAEMVISNSFQTAIFIDTALGAVTAHTGTRVLLQVSSSTADDEFWTDYTEFVCCIGTAGTEAVTNNPLAAAGTVITVASTTGFVADGALLIFIEDATPANSETMLMVSAVTDTSVTVQDGVKREHANTAILWNIAESRQIVVPVGFLRARVIIDNTYDSDGATIYTRTRMIETTSLT